MSKISTIVHREYMSRVRKKSFLIMTFLTPLLFLGLFLVPVWIAKNQDNPQRHIAIIDQSGQFQNAFVSNENYKFEFINPTLDSLHSEYKKNNYSAMMIIPKDYMKDSIFIYSEEPITLDVKQTLKTIVNTYTQQQILLSMNIDPKVIAETQKDIPLKTLQWSKKTGDLQDSSTELNTVLGYIGAFIIYMFIFMYGTQLMRSSMEEKKDRIVEILVSSTKPFQLMLGKIVGVALVAFTQFGLWLIAVIGILFAAKNLVLSTGDPQIMSILIALQNIDSAKWIFLFLFYFIGGYLLYGSLFAAIGSAVDNETDTQQFMLPLTLPLILAIVFAQTIINEPNGNLAVIMSQIPFTSPVVMMVRLGFGVSWGQIILSVALLSLTFILSVFIAGKIYRIGVLSYGKKITYKDLWQWITYKG